MTTGMCTPGALLETDPLGKFWVARTVQTQGPKRLSKIYFERHFKARICFTESNIFKVKRVLQVESQHSAYVC